MRANINTWSNPGTVQKNESRRSWKKQEEVRALTSLSWGQSSHSTVHIQPSEKDFRTKMDLWNRSRRKTAGQKEHTLRQMSCGPMWHGRNPNPFSSRLNTFRKRGQTGGGSVMVMQQNKNTLAGAPLNGTRWRFWRGSGRFWSFYSDSVSNHFCKIKWGVGVFHPEIGGFGHLIFPK